MSYNSTFFYKIEGIVRYLNILINHRGWSLENPFFIFANLLNFLQSLSQNEKNTILKFDKKQSLVDHELQKCTFTPNINTSTVESKVYSYVRKK